MTADDFLALVERHPMPWRYDSRAAKWDDATGAYVSSADFPADLIDAAPAIAAAAIRLLRGITPPDFRIPLIELRALRDALPTEIRP